MSKYTRFWNDAHNAKLESEGLAASNPARIPTVNPCATREEIARFRTGINAPFPVVELETANVVIDEAIAADHYRQLAREMAEHLLTASKVVAAQLACIERLAAACVWFEDGKPGMASACFDNADSIRTAGV